MDLISLLASREHPDDGLSERAAASERLQHSDELITCTQLPIAKTGLRRVKIKTNL